MQQNLGFGLVWACFGTDGQFRVHEFLVILITISSRVSKIGKNNVNVIGPFYPQNGQHTKFNENMKFGGFNLLTSPNS